VAAVKKRISGIGPRLSRLALVARQQQAARIREEELRAQAEARAPPPEPTEPPPSEAPAPGPPEDAPRDAPADGIAPSEGDPPE
jgi:hypothetical protein